MPFKRVVGNYRKHNDKRYTEFKHELGYFAIQAMHGQELLKGAIKLSADFYKPKPQKSKYVTGEDAINPSYGDLDNHVKAVLDALTGICYLDDRQVIELHARKFFGNPKVIITLEAF